jgi:RND family efflux transporter MFP subunit
MNTRSFKWPAIVAALSVVGAGGWWLFLRSKDEPSASPVVAVQTAKVATRSLSQIVTAEAILFPRNQAAITPKITAPVSKFYVNRGSPVRAGQLLAVLENRDLAAAVTDNQGGYEQAQAVYETTVGASLPEEIKKAELELQSTKEEFDADQKLYTSRQELFQQGALPRKDLDQAGVALAQAKGQFQLAEHHLEALKSVTRAQTLKSATGQLASAKGKYEGAAAQMGYSEIRSPIDGVVTDRPTYPGETAAAGVPLLTVMDTSSVIAKAHIPQDQAALLQPGAPATLTAPGAVTAEGKVTLISPALDPNSTTVEIWIEAPNRQQLLRPGMTVQLAIVARVVKDALTVPASAVLKSPEGGDRVMVVENDVAQGHAVETGIREGEAIQITKGLAPGATIVAVGAYGLPDKIHVKEAEVPKPAGKAEGEAE